MDSPNNSSNASSPFQMVPSASPSIIKERCAESKLKSVQVSGPSSTSSFASTFHQSMNSAFSTDTETVPLAESSSASFSTTTCPGTELNNKKSCETAWQILDRRNGTMTSDGHGPSLMVDNSWFNVSEQDREHGYQYTNTTGGESRPRPSSANSIASITKKILHVAADATLMIKHHGSMCMANHEGQAYDDSEASDIPLPLRSSNQNRVYPTPISPEAASSSGPSTPKKQSPEKDSMEETGTKSKLSPSADIPLRQTYSLPLKRHDATLDRAMKEMQIRRSTSTPAAFLQSRRGSAFGRFPSSNSLQKVKVNLSASDPGVSLQNNTKNPEVVEMSTSTNARAGKERSVLELPVPLAHTKSNLDNESVASRELSTVSYEAQRRRRRQRQKRRQKEKKCSHPSKVVPEQVFAEFISNDGEKLDLRNTSEISNDIPDVNEDHSVNAKSVYVPLENDVDANGEDSDDEFAGTAFLEEDSAKPLPVESENAVPPPAYHQIIDDEPQTFHNTRPTQPSRLSQYPRRAPTPPQTPPSQRLTSHPRLGGVLQLKTANAGSMSPSSYESCSYSRSTNRSGISSNTCNQTFSTSLSGTASCNRSITSSVAEADREVRDTNRRELRRREGFDVDGSMSIQSSDTTSTNPHAYLALVSSPAQLRDGANMPVDRFFAGKNGSGNASALQSTLSRRPPPPLNARSPVTVSSNSVGNTNSSASVSEEPPRFVSLSENLPAKIGAPHRSMPPRSRSSDKERASKFDSSGYSKLGSEGRNGRSSRSSSKSSSSRSSAKSRRKNKASKYQRMRSSPIPDRTPTSTPIPFCSLLPSPNTSQGTPLSPPNQFKSSLEQIDLPKPSARRPYQSHNQLHGINACVSPYDEEQRSSVSRVGSDSWGFRELSTESAVKQINGCSFVTPEKD
jgi:hypothetical protein